MPVRYFVECVSQIKHIISVIHYRICGAVCLQFTHFSCDDWENIYTLSYHHQIGSITHCLGLGHETMKPTVCLSIFLWICDMARLLRGTFLSWWYLPRIWPSVTDMQCYYHARYPTDDWHLANMFSLVDFSVEVCLKGVFPHSVGTWRDSCVRVYAPLTLTPSPHEKYKIEQGRPSSPLNQRGGIWSDAWVCLHYWVIIWVAG